MRAWLMESYGGVEKLRLGEVPDPEPAPGEIVLRVRFAALNPADAFLAKGQYPAKPGFPHILGRDGVGEAIGTGEILGILRCNAGVEVWGTLAEKVAAPLESLAPIPQGWTLDQMAAAPLTFLTAWQALTQWDGPPREGSVLLVTGASGGVGVASVLLGKSMGLQVVALTRSAEKGEKLKQLGADFVFDPQDRELKQKYKAAGLRPVDIAIDNVAGSLFNQVIALMGYGGRISVVGRSGSVVPEFNTGTLFFRRLRVGGVAVGDYSPAQAQEIWKEIVARLSGMGKKPVVDHVFAFEEVPAAFARLAEGPMGKVLVRV